MKLNEFKSCLYNFCISTGSSGDPLDSECLSVINGEAKGVLPCH